MKFVVQRVSRASVSVNGKVVSSIGKGLFVLVGIKEGDTEKEAQVLAQKLAKLRVMPLGSAPRPELGTKARGKTDKEGKMNWSVGDVGGEMLVVSQFTLYADNSGGNRPNFIKAAKPEIAKPLYEHFVNKLKAQSVKVKTGKFGEYMEISLELDGPVTIIMETRGL